MVEYFSVSFRAVYLFVQSATGYGNSCLAAVEQLCHSSYGDTCLDQIAYPKLLPGEFGVKGIKPIGEIGISGVDGCAKLRPLRFGDLRGFFTTCLVKKNVDVGLAESGFLQLLNITESMVLSVG